MPYFVLASADRASSFQPVVLQILASEDHDDAGHDDACFMMYSLSHTVNETCSVAAVQRYADGSISQTNVDNSFSYSPRSPYQLQRYDRSR